MNLDTSRPLSDRCANCRLSDGDSITLHKNVSAEHRPLSASFWPAAPFFLIRKGKDININKGIVLEVFTDAEHVLKSGKPSRQRDRALWPCIGSRDR